jgi:hypothetical protein
MVAGVGDRGAFDVVVVVQHRAARERDVLGGLLAGGTELVVEPAQVGVRPRPGVL